MKKEFRLMLSSVMICAAVFSLQAQTSSFKWAAGGGGAHHDFPSSTAIGPSGAVYVVGAIGASAAFGTNILQGGTLTTNVFGGQTNVMSSGVAFLAKYSPTGDLEWVLEDVGSTNSVGRGVAVDALENIYLTGEFSGIATFGSLTATNLTEAGDIFLAKINAAGTPVWLKKAGGPSVDYAYSIGLDATGNAYITGFASGQLSFGSTNLNTGLNKYGGARSVAYYGDSRIGYRIMHQTIENIVLFS